MPKATSTPSASKRSNKAKLTQTSALKTTPTPRKKKEMKEVKEADEDKEEGDDIDWTLDLTWSLITAINENEEIKRGLFPPPGCNASTSKGGGKAKSDHHFALAKEVFGAIGGPYSDTFSGAISNKSEEKKWGTKIKNRLAKLTKLTRKYIDELGETGAGINSVDEIDRSEPNAFTNKWDAIEKTFPYFFEWRALIGQRPNVTPVGLGNSSTDIDFSILDDADDKNLEDDMDDDNNVEASKRGVKRKASGSDLHVKDEEEDTKPIMPSLRTSKAGLTKPKAIDALTGVAVAEEKTKQAQLSLEEARAKADVQVKLQLIKAKQEKDRLREERKRMKLEMDMKRMDWEMKRMEMTMASARHSQPHVADIGTSFPSTRSSTPMLEPASFSTELYTFDPDTTSLPDLPHTPL